MRRAYDKPMVCRAQVTLTTQFVHSSDMGGETIRRPAPMLAAC